ncbi:hypothetical protein RYX36_003452 [Vicia faba]
MHVMNVIMFCRTATHIPVVHLPEEPILQFAVALRIEINRGFTALRDIGSGRDLKKTLTVTFRGPSDTHLDSLVGQALFGDGAAALIVGSDPIPEIEKPIFEMVWTAQTIAPDSEGAIDGHLREAGITFHLLKDVLGLFQRTSIKHWLRLSNHWEFLITTLSFGLHTQVDRQF